MNLERLSLEVGEKPVGNTGILPEGLAFVVLFVVIVVLPFVFVRDRISLCSPGCPGTHFVDQTGLELKNSPASASPVLGLKAYATTPGKIQVFITCF